MNGYTVSLWQLSILFCYRTQSGRRLQGDRQCKSVKWHFQSANKAENNTKLHRLQLKTHSYN